VPRQGTSTKTRSKLPAWRLTHLSRSPFSAGAAQAARGAVEAILGDLAGDELAAIGHSGGERQGLAARPGAEIDDAHAGPRIGQQRGNLRALVLHLDKALPERGEIAERHPAAETQPERREGCRLRGYTVPGEHRAGRLAIAFEEIDPQVRRRGTVEGSHLPFQVFAEKPLEIGLEPFRQVIGHRLRHFGVAQGMTRKAAQQPLLASRQPGRAEAVAVTARLDDFGAPAFDQLETGQHAGARVDLDCVLADPPVER